MGGGDLPAVGEELVKLADGRGGDAGEDVAEAGHRLDLVPLAADDQAEQHRGGQ